MGLLDEMRSETTRTGMCTVGALLATLPDDDAGDLTAALKDTAIPHTVIARVLKAHGHSMHEKRVAAHRKGECACAR